MHLRRVPDLVLRNPLDLADILLGNFPAPLAALSVSAPLTGGNSFVRETETLVILNGSREISCTVDLVRKDVGHIREIGDRGGVPLDLNPLLIRPAFRPGWSTPSPRSPARK